MNVDLQEAFTQDARDARYDATCMEAESLMGYTDQPSETECPHINGEDHRCDTRLTLRRLDEAFLYCLGEHRACPTYQQLAWEQQDRESSNPQHFIRHRVSFESSGRGAIAQQGRLHAVAVTLTLDRQPLDGFGERFRGLGNRRTSQAQTGFSL